jgi:hypothetical protein
VEALRSDERRARFIAAHPVRPTDVQVALLDPQVAREARARLPILRLSYLLALSSVGTLSRDGLRSVLDSRGAVRGCLSSGLSPWRDEYSENHACE